jgi:2-amino-4-hydroxy-6-hydroxymethyldihydropteridine diphosphokinase
LCQFENAGDVIVFPRHLRDKNSVILVALGANQPSSAGEPADTLRAALAQLEAHGVTIAAISRFYTSPAWPDPADPPFVNAVARVLTGLPPDDLIALLHAVEERFGRERRVVNAPRTLDLDIVDYDGLVRSAPGGLILPHPRLHQRAFVLAPLLDVAPAWVHPVSGIAGAALLAGVRAEGQTATPIV